MIVVEYKLEVYFIVANEIRYGDVSTEAVGAAMIALLGNKFGPTIDILHGDLRPDKQRFSHDTVRVSHDGGMHRRSPANPVPPRTSPGWTPVYDDDLEIVEVPVEEEDTLGRASGMPPDDRMDDTMERFITITDDIRKEEKKKKKPKKKKPKHRGGYGYRIPDRKGRKHRPRHIWRRGRHRGDLVLPVIEAQPQRKELE